MLVRSDLQKHAATRPGAFELELKMLSLLLSVEPGPVALEPEQICQELLGTAVPHFDAFVLVLVLLYTLVLHFGLLYSLEHCCIGRRRWLAESLLCTQFP